MAYNQSPSQTISILDELYKYNSELQPIEFLKCIKYDGANFELNYLNSKFKLTTENNIYTLSLWSDDIDNIFDNVKPKYDLPDDIIHYYDMFNQPVYFAYSYSLHTPWIYPWLSHMWFPLDNITDFIDNPEKWKDWLLNYINDSCI